MSAAVSLRPYQASDEDAAIALWLRAWQGVYPDRDFSARLDWWRERWRSTLVPSAAIVLAEIDSAMAGFITVDAKGYVDQLLVAPDRWRQGIGAILMAEAKRMSPQCVDLHVNRDNARALAFYAREGFSIRAETVNPLTGNPTYLMSWRP